MKKHISLTLAIIGLSGSSIFGATINWGIETTGGTYSDGSPIPDGYTFELGTFQGFSPTAGNVEQWDANLVTSGLTGNTATWQNLGNASFPTHGSADASTVFNSGGAVAQGDQGYIWGYNSLDIAGTSEWVLLTNTAWAFPAPTPPGGLPLESVNWFSSDAGTELVFGSSFVNDQGVLGNSLQTAQAIPEPSTYALIFGLGILGFLGFRRFRK